MLGLFGTKGEPLKSPAVEVGWRGHNEGAYYGWLVLPPLPAQLRLETQSGPWLQSLATRSPNQFFLIPSCQRPQAPCFFWPMSVHLPSLPLSMPPLFLCHFSTMILSSWWGHLPRAVAVSLGGLDILSSSLIVRGLWKPGGKESVSEGCPCHVASAGLPATQPLAHTPEACMACTHLFTHPPFTHLYVSTHSRIYQELPYKRYCADFRESVMAS